MIEECMFCEGAGDFEFMEHRFICMKCAEKYGIFTDLNGKEIK